MHQPLCLAWKLLFFSATASAPKPPGRPALIAFLVLVEDKAIRGDSQS
eukprot:CAMPEP_0197678058 /NCGR_PEP_ID=MMETSP1338-20131121/89425_1 /TAXON_ID=43686 ORGANISM="Pelagodinium beii, Strain RCC1491" /NCGR_SAMPLE_ID=MMETSP1338 /ASSEMBLY_ACC=CAM_ASM_000754 /LENGTH=47 /DNA_ID= /DNA_START= /DNA_END= /DNA_ORIENTATION=